MIGETLLRFKRRTNGTGSVVSTTNLGADGASECRGTYTLDTQGGILIARCRIFYFASTALDSEANVASARKAALAYIDTLQNSLVYRPPIVKPIARGKIVMPNIHDNFGDLVYLLTDGSGETTILSNCTLADIKVADDPGVEGIAIDLVFQKPSTAAAV